MWDFADSCESASSRMKELGFKLGVEKNSYSSRAPDSQPTKNGQLWYTERDTEEDIGAPIDVSRMCG